jgi:tetratricopeptide (TPR) repeat protein
VEIRRALVARNPDAYRPDLAMSLNNLAIRYAELGRREEALAPAEEAVEIYRALVARNPDAYRPALASSLNNLANRYAELGRREEALAPAEEAVEIRRALVARNPDAYRPALASSLNNLAIRYAESGLDGQAKRLVREAASLNEPPIIGLLATPGVRRAQQPAPAGSTILDWLRFADLNAAGRDWAVQAIGLGVDVSLRERIVLRAAALSFCPSALLLGALDPVHSLGQELFYVAQVGGPADRLDGTSGRLHAANRLWALDISGDEQALDYARHFCCFVDGPDGPFCIKEPGAHFWWQADADARTQAQVAALVQPARVTGRDVDGLVMVSATMLYGMSLLSVDLAIAGRALETKLPGDSAPRRMLAGQVEMLNDLALADDLPLQRLALQ